MRHGALFNGIGGFMLAAHWAGWENIWYSEINEFGNKVTKHHFPKAKQYGDIKTTDWNAVEPVDIITGGFPCQPFSQAGKRAGTEDDRYLWPEMFEVIKCVKPRWVVAENVYGLVSWNDGLVLEQVLSDLESEGYETTAFILPAASVNAPHKRDRIWIVAHTDNAGTGIRMRNNGKWQEENKGWERQSQPQFGQDSFNGIITNPYSKRYRRCNIESGSDSSEKRKMDSQEQQHGNRVRCETKRCESVASNTKNKRHEQSGDSWKRRTGFKNGNINASNTINPGLQRSQQFRSSEEWNREKASGSVTECSEIPSWQNWPTQSPVCGRNDGISGRLDSITFPKWRRESIKALGNAIVPQVAYQIFKAIEEYEQILSQTDI